MIINWTWADLEGEHGVRTPSPPPEKSQVAINLLRNSSMDPFEKQLDLLGPIASRGRNVRPSVKYNDDLKHTKNKQQRC